MATSTVRSTADSLSKLHIDGGDDWAAAAPNLLKNLSLLSPEQVELAKMLLEMGQSHLFEHWPEPGDDDDEKRELFNQVARLNSSYPGGLASYIKTARELLADSRVGKNPYDGFTPSMNDLIICGYHAKMGVFTLKKLTMICYRRTSFCNELLDFLKKISLLLIYLTAFFAHVTYNVIYSAKQVPSGESLTFGDDTFLQYEDAGVKEARKAAFVLVAGGLGERLGYNGIKVALPLETTTGTCFLRHYIESILALQETSCRLAQGDGPIEIPLAIMTSDDTHSRTMELLESNAYFGMKPTQVNFLKQEKVACLDDNDARLALDPRNKYRIQTKPHGHGDVHSLLYSSGVLKEWHDAGRRWVLFFQDTNGLLFKAVPSALGVSATKGYHVNSLAVPRKAKEAIGGITKLTHKDGRTMVINVEYNQLDPLLRASGYPNGDVNSETGYSPFPGNINQLIFEIGPYLEELTKTGGAIKEFVNPKYKDSTKTAFKSSTRLECMMQDYPKTLPPSARVGFTVMDAWVAYAPVKNNPEDAAKVPKGNPYHSATSGEMAIYKANSLILRKAGVKVDDPVLKVFNGQEVEVWPRIVWKPKWGLTFSDVKSKVHGNCSVTQRSTMVIEASNCYIVDLSLDGALIIDAADGTEQVEVSGPVQNKGWTVENVDYKDTSVPEEVRIRGFKINKIEQLVKP